MRKGVRRSDLDWVVERERKTLLSFLLLLIPPLPSSSSSRLLSVKNNQHRHLPLLPPLTPFFPPVRFRFFSYLKSVHNCLDRHLYRRRKVEFVFEIQEVMNHCAIQQRSVSAVCEEMISREALVCPKPIRIGVFNSAAADTIRTIRWNLSRQTEVSESAAGADLLDILLLKNGSRDLEPFCTQVDSSPPFFSGSPPSRVSNPLIKDARFIEEKRGSPVSQLQLSITGPSSPSSYARKGGYGMLNFGNNPVVRIEGFSCMNRDGRNGAVSAHA